MCNLGPLTKAEKFICSDWSRAARAQPHLLAGGPSLCSDWSRAARAQPHLLGGEGDLELRVVAKWNRTNFSGVIQSDTDAKIKFQEKKVSIGFKLENINPVDIERMSLKLYYFCLVIYH